MTLNNKPVLGYWNIRGLAGAIGLLLGYTETDFENKFYTQADKEHGFSRKEWTDEKEKVGLDFPNLPYYIDGDRKITQSNAILRYIARKHDLVGKTEEEQYKVDMLEQEIFDFRMKFVGLCYSPEFEKRKQQFLVDVKVGLGRFEKWIEKGSKWLAGDDFTYVDIVLYDVLDQHLVLEPKILDDFKGLKNFYEKVDSLEKIQKFKKDKRYIHCPLNNKSAQFGNQ